jgi:tetratricopeptide (TPR) repeat protein
MASIIPGYEYDIFISYRQKDNKYDGWVTDFVGNLKRELEATFKEEISVYFDINPHDGLLETHDVSDSLKEKLKCLVFIPIISRTYCDPRSFAWEHEFLAFIEQATQDPIGMKVKLPNGNVGSRVLPIRIHDLDTKDLMLCESALGGHLRGVEFIYKEPGVNKPLKADDDEKNNLNKTKYRIQINKVANAVQEIISGLIARKIRPEKETHLLGTPSGKPIGTHQWQQISLPDKSRLQKILSGIFIAVFLILAGVFSFPKLFKQDRKEFFSSKGEISVAVMPFQNLTNDATRNFWEVMIQDNLINSLSNERYLKIRQAQNINSLLESHDLTNYASLKPTLARSVSQKLDANVFVQGSINQIGNITRLNAKLIDSKTEQVFQSFQVDGNPGNIIQLADSMTHLVKNFLIVRLLQKELPPAYKMFVDASGKLTDPEVFRFYVEGMKFWNKLDLTQAREMYLKALEIDSTFIIAMIYLTHTYGNQEHYQEAKKWALKLNGYKQKVTQLEKILIETVNAHFFETPSETIKYYRMLLDIDDQNAVGYYYLGRYYAKLQLYDYAIPEFEKNLELLRQWGIKPGRASDYIHLGHAYHNTGQFSKEQKLYQKAEKDFPNDPSIIRRQAILALSRGKTKQADKYLARFKPILLNQGASEASIQTQLGWIYEEAEKLDQAEKHLRSALLLEPENPQRMNFLAYLLIKKDINVYEGMELIHNALQIKPNDCFFLHTKGLGLYKQGEYRESLEVLRKSWELRKEQAIYSHDAFLHLEQAKKAVANL